MPIFIEDFYEKYSDALLIYDKTQDRMIPFNDYKSKDFTNTYLGQYHPWFIEKKAMQTEKIPKDALGELNLRFETEENKKRYTEILLADYDLTLLLNGKRPCYLAFFKAYPDFNTFLLNGFCAIFLGGVFHALLTIEQLLISMQYLITAGFSAARGDHYQATDQMILAKYRFCISLMYALHSILSPVLAAISFITRSAASIHALYTDNEDRLQPIFTL